MAIVITNVTELQAMELFPTLDYELGNNIDASATSLWNEDPGNPGTYFGFDPVGTSATKFTGEFDGKGFTISNLFIGRPTESYVGLFGYIDGATVKNVSLTTCDITGKSYTGALIGRVAGAAVISDCCSAGTVDGVSGVGGLIGETYSTATITDCSSSCTVVGTDNNVGGLVGDTGDVESLLRCYATGNVSGTSDYVGGLLGYASDGTIDKCYASGDVVGSADYVGGLVGSCGAYAANCYAVGDVTVDDYVGGLFGEVSGDTDNCYSAGAVAGDDDVGGLIGENNGSVTDCFWDTETSGQATSDGGTGKTTVQMKKESTYTNWSFGDIWGITSQCNNGYPCLLNVTPGCLYTQWKGNPNVDQLIYQHVERME